MFSEKFAQCCAGSWLPGAGFYMEALQRQEREIIDIITADRSRFVQRLWLAALQRQLRI